MDPKTLQLLMGSSAAGAVADKNYIEDVFSTWLYTGNGSTQTITNGIDLSTKGGLTWIKSRSGGFSLDHKFTDTVRGATKALSSNTSSAEITDATSLTAFTTSGFTLGNAFDFNLSNVVFTSWTFRKQPKFFDVVTYTGDGIAGKTISHNLGSVPGCIIVKSASATEAWRVYHRSADSNPQTVGLTLNNTGARTTATSFWNDTAPTSTQFTVGTNSSVNASGQTYVAYLFAHDAGGFGDTGNDNVISCGGYTGNGSTNGPTVTLGWEPQWLLVKRANSTGNWNLIDSMRGFVVGGTDAVLSPNLSNNESTGTFVTPTATGFQLNTTDSGYNASGGAYIYIAIRRGPMKTPTDATKVFNATLSSGAEGTEITTAFPLDTQILRVPGAIDSNYIMDRLRGVSTVNSTQSYPYLFIDSPSGEGSVGITRDWKNTGFDVPSFTSFSTTVYLNFSRAPGFFDVVAYTGTGVARTINHNLGVAPELIFVKNRSTGFTNWLTYSVAIGNTKFLYLNLNVTPDTAIQAWNNTSPTSTVFSLGTYTDVNGSGNSHIAYLFATCPGVSKVGSYTGTGTTLNVDCGFTNGARFVLIKRTDSTGDWYVWDTARGIISGNDPYFFFNSNTAQVTNTDYIDPLSSGFQISSTAPNAINASGGSYIYLSVA